MYLLLAAATPAPERRTEMLLELPEPLMMSLCLHLGAADLARLELTCGVFHAQICRAPNALPTTLPEFAAQQAVGQHSDSWRIERRADESWKHTLYILQGRLWPLTQAAAGCRHTLVVSSKTTVLACGLNDNMQLARPTASGVGLHALPIELAGRQVASVAAGGVHSAVLTHGGELLTCGCDAAMPPETPLLPVTCGFPQRTRVALIAAGESHSACLTAAGAAYTWGDGSFGRLGHGNITDCDAPRRVEHLASERVIGVDCGNSTTVFAATFGGELYMCGYLAIPDVRRQSLLGQLGYDREESWFLARKPERIAFPGTHPHMYV